MNGCREEDKICGLNFRPPPLGDIEIEHVQKKAEIRNVKTLKNSRVEKFHTYSQ